MTNENRNQKSNWFRQSFEATKAFMGAGGLPRTRTTRLFALMVLAIVPALVLVPVTAHAQCNPSRIKFEFFFLPDNVIVDTSQDMFVCLANVCDAHDVPATECGEPSNSRLELKIPVGTEASDLIHPDDVGNLDCIDAPPGWCCNVDIISDPDNVIVTFEPDPRIFGDDVCVAELETLCFTLTNVGVNSAGGNTLSVMDQFIIAAHATDPVNRVLSVFKSLPGGPGAPSPWQTMGNDIFYNDGNVGIGTTMPQSPLDVAGEILGDDLTISGLVMAKTVESTKSGFIFPDGTSQITAAGPGGITGHEIRTDSVTGVFVLGDNVTVECFCDEGQVVLGGGGKLEMPNDAATFRFTSSEPVFDDKFGRFGWSASWIHVADLPQRTTVTVFAICADGSRGVAVRNR